MGLTKKYNEIIAIGRERQKYGLAVMTVPGLKKLSKEEYEKLRIAGEHIIEDIKAYQREGVKFSIGTKIQIFKSIEYKNRGNNGTDRKE